MASMQVRGVTINHEVLGSGPEVLHVSGSGSDLRSSGARFSPLNDHFTGLHYDHRGLGQSELGDHQPTMEDFAEDAAALCDAVGWDRCHVVGTSFGGMVALELAVRHPELVDRLVLCCTSPGGSLPSYPLHELQDLPVAERTERSLAILDTRYDPEAAEAIPGFGDIAVVREMMAQEREGESALGYRRQLEARRRHDVFDRLGEITAPTLVCAGRHDGIAPVVNSEAIVAGIPDATLAVFDGGHAFMMQDPAAFPAIVDFLERG